MINSSDEKQINKILKSPEQYIVANFQRSYVWNNNEQDVLINDFINHMKTSQNGEYKCTNFFLGTILSYKEKNKYFIIDGQQRLITIAILLTVIRDLAFPMAKFKRNAEHSQNLQTEINDLLTLDSNSYRILPNQNYGQNFFISVLYSEDSENNMIAYSLNPRQSLNPAKDYFWRIYHQAYLNINKTLNNAFEPKWTKSKQLIFLSGLLNQIKNSSFVDLNATNKDDAYKIFADINFKGKKLVPVDLAKNLIFSFIRDEDTSFIDNLNDQWATFYNFAEQHTSFSFSEFFKYIWFVFFPKNLNAELLTDDSYIGDSISEFLEDFENHRPRSTKIKYIETAVKSMRNIVEVYNELQTPENISVFKRHNWPNYKIKLQLISKTAISHSLKKYLFLLLRIHMLFLKSPESIKVEYRQLIDIVADIVILHNAISESDELAKIDVLMLIEEELDQLFIQILTTDKNTRLDFVISNFLKSFDSKITSDVEQLMIESLSKLTYSKHSDELINFTTKLFLMRFNESEYKTENPTIEHIFDESSPNKVVLQIGNLIILEENLNKECNDLKNKNTGTFSLKDKSEVYDKSHYQNVIKFQNDFEKLNLFDINQINSRGRQMGESFIRKMFYTD
ncbi:DUF262 domain-containing protein [Leuconostoc koreense]|nr:DUF262 domain-containing protein [Leuconostoc mesenteroides]QGM25778.1 DUF262 domain-containing protein [Leuconostoc mesenteroides subsp. mesenteroides]